MLALCCNASVCQPASQRVSVRVMVFNVTCLSYIVTVCFIGGGNRNTRWKSPTCSKTQQNFIT